MTAAPDSKSPKHTPAPRAAEPRTLNIATACPHCKRELDEIERKRGAKCDTCGGEMTAVEAHWNAGNVHYFDEYCPACLRQARIHLSRFEAEREAWIAKGKTEARMEMAISTKPRETAT